MDIVQIMSFLLAGVVMLAVYGLMKLISRLMKEKPEDKGVLVKVQFPNPAVASREKIEEFLKSTTNSDILWAYYEYAKNDSETPIEIVAIIRARYFEVVEENGKAMS